MDDLRTMKLRMLKRVFAPPEVCLGPGSLERIGCLEPARVLVVASRRACESGMLEKVTQQLKGAVAWEFRQLAPGEPKAAAIRAMGPDIEAFAPQWIVAVGGGSVMDAAKFLWAQFEHPGLNFTGTSPVPIGMLRQKARFIAVPTTAGSGSEASQAAVLSGEDGSKIPYVSPYWVPDIVILEPALSASLPRDTTLATGFDALTHAVESAVSGLGNSFTRALAATAARLVVKHLPVASENPSDLAAREGMLEAAFLAGMCQSVASTGAAHALSHASAKLFGASHGISTGFYLVPTMRWNHAKNPSVYDDLAMGCGLPDGAALIRVLAGLAERLGVPQDFRGFLGKTLDVAEKQALAETASKDVCLRTNANRMKLADLAQLLSEIG